MKTFKVSSIIRSHLKGITPYSSARDDFNGIGQIFLDANENPFGNEYNRYPDPHQIELKKAVERIKHIAIENIFIGNGSDEPIDLLYRAFCEPGIDNVITLPPTYGMYKVSANINNVSVKEILLNKNFDVDVEGILAAVNSNTKIIWLCSPNNPTGNSLNADAIKKLIENFSGLVVVDEAYIDFSEQPSFVSWIQNFSNLIVLQTLSKAWALASLRVGLCFGHSDVIRILNTIKPPYNISGLNQERAKLSLSNPSNMKQQVDVIKQQRQWLMMELNKLMKVASEVYPSDSNFLLVKVDNANALYKFLTERRIIVRNRSKEPNCENCLRITIGSEVENQLLVKALKEYETNIIY